MNMLARCTSRNLLLLLLFFVFQTECFRWIKNVYEGNVFANRSQVALFRFKYSLEGADTSSLKIKCGYLKRSAQGVTDLVVLVHKKGHNTGMTLSGGRLPGNQGQVEAYQELIPGVPGGGVDRTVVGFKIMYAQLSHPTMYRCQSIFRIGDNDIDDINSEVKNLVVLDPPILKDCLQDLQEVKEDEDLEFSCSVTGNPPPTLQCTLLSGLGMAIEKFPDPATTNNITRHLFRKIHRDAEQIMCLADGGDHTGHTNITMDIIVHHTPHAPELVEFIPATNHTCINIKWSIIPNNETGGEITQYKIRYYLTADGEISSETVTLPVEDLKAVHIYPTTDPFNPEGFYRYQLCGLKPDDQYTIEVYGVNRFGDGHKEPKEVVPGSVEVAASQADEASVGVIIGGIIAGIVFIVIFVVLAVWCSTRSKKHEKLPTSHVEDAVDYPPGIGQSLYANIDKNKNKAPSHAGSATEYPDVVNDTSEVRPMVSSNSYEQSNKAFV